VDADLRQRRIGLRDEVVRGRIRTEDALRHAVGGAPRAVRLHVPASVAGPLAGSAVLDDHHVPELGPTAVETAAEDDAAAHPGSERQHHEIGQTPAGAEAKLGQRRCARVVHHADGQAEPALELLAEGEVAERDVDGAEHVAGALVDPRRHAEPDRLGLARPEGLDGLFERCQKLLLRADRGRVLEGLVDGAVCADQTGEDLCSSQVNGNHAGTLHDGRYPTSPDGP
jgi:hypothetical protein